MIWLDKGTATAKCVKSASSVGHAFFFACMFRLARGFGLLRFDIPFGSNTFVLICMRLFVELALHCTVLGTFLQGMEWVAWGTLPTSREAMSKEKQIVCEGLLLFPWQVGQLIRDRWPELIDPV